MGIEKDAEVIRFLDMVSEEKGLDLEAWETGLRRVVLEAGARMLETILHDVGSGRREDEVVCRCGKIKKSAGLREKSLLSVLGTIRFRRSLYLCSQCGRSRFPGDELLGIVGTGFSPGVRHLMARAGSKTSFAEAEEDLYVYANLEVHRKDIERVSKEVGELIEIWMGKKRAKAIDDAEAGSPTDKDEKIPVFYISFDGTGIPMRSVELKGRKGKQADGSARTREVKLGCVFTQTTVNGEGKPVRDPDSTSYAGAIESSAEFGWRIYAEAVRRGIEKAEKVVALTDGAGYNRSIIEMHFPGAIHIIDFYHAREHLHDVIKLLLVDDKLQFVKEEWLQLLDEGKIESLVKDIRKYLPHHGNRRKLVLKEIGYFQDHAGQMRYADFKQQGLFIGSGVIEAGCRTLIGERLKKSGMFWSVSGANAIIALRCSQFSRSFADFWEENVA